METSRPTETPELVTDGMVPVQHFVTRAIPMPPGTPAKPRPKRPPLDKLAGEAPEVPRNSDG